MEKVPDPEITRVNDLIGLISRKVIQRPATTSPKNPATPPKAPPVPVTQPYASAEVLALSVYNGWIPFDAWLNHSDTTWNKCSHVLRVLSANEHLALKYLAACDLPTDMKTAGYMRGKIAAMEGICLLRQIYLQIRQGIYTQPAAVETDVRRFIRFVSSKSNVSAVAHDMFTIAQSAKSLDEFELKWFSTIIPVYNLFHVRRIFKARVQKVVLNECLALLHQRHWELHYGLYHFLGVMSRLYYFDLYDPYWNEQTLRPLRNLFFLFSQATMVDFDFTRQMFPTLISFLQIRHSVKPEGMYRCFVAWHLYKNALRGTRLNKVVETLSVWEKELSISIRSNPKILASLYREMVYHDLAYAEREVHKVVIIVDCLKQT